MLLRFARGPGSASCSLADREGRDLPEDTSGRGGRDSVVVLLTLCREHRVVTYHPRGLVTLDFYFWAFLAGPQSVRLRPLSGGAQAVGSWADGGSFCFVLFSCVGFAADRFWCFWIPGRIEGTVVATVFLQRRSSGGIGSW